MNHKGLLFKLRSVGVGGAVFSVISQVLSGRRLCVSVDGGLSSFVDVVSGVTQGSVLDPLLFILYTADLFSIVDNLLVGYADDATLISVAQRPANRVSLCQSLILSSVTLTRLVIGVPGGECVLMLVKLRR